MKAHECCEVKRTHHFIPMLFVLLTLFILSPANGFAQTRKPKAPEAEPTPLVTPTVPKTPPPATTPLTSGGVQALITIVRSISFTDLLSGGALQTGALALLGVLVAMAVKAKRSGLERSPAAFFAGIAGRFVFPLLYSSFTNLSIYR